MCVLSHVRLWLHGLQPPGSSVHGIFQARILPFSPPGDLPDPSDQTHISSVSCILKMCLCFPSNHFPAPFPCSHRFLSRCCEVLIGVRLQRCFPWHEHGSHPAYPLLWEIRLWEAAGTVFLFALFEPWRGRMRGQKTLALLGKSFSSCPLTNVCLP